MLTGLLLGQDLLLLKSGKFYKGVFIDKVDKNIIFNIEGDSIHTEFSINDIDIIKTNNVEYYYPFDAPTKEVLSKNTTSSTFDLNTLPKEIISKQEIVNMSEEEKGFLYGKYIINPYSNMFINLLIPTYGYYRIKQWNRGLRIAAAGLSLGALIDIYDFFEDGPSLGRFSEERFERKMNIMWSMFFVDLYIQTKKYNKNLNKYIFGQEKSFVASMFTPINYKHYFNIFGFPNHRIGVGMFGYSLIKRTKKNNEYYMGIGTVIINLSITAGWKYYFKKSNADDYYFAMSLVGSMGETDNRYDETKKVSMDFIAGNFSAGYEKRLNKNMYLNMEIFTLTGIMPNSKGVTDGIRYLVVPSFHFNYRI